MTHITTASRARFDLVNDPDPTLITLGDVVTGLAHLCRFNGQVPEFYSVADHSIRVAECVQRWGGAEGEVRAALLHDAHEAFIGDIPTPIKDVLGGAWLRLEFRAWGAVAKRFQVPRMLPGIVLRADREVLHAEFRDLRGIDLGAADVPRITPLDVPGARRVFLEWCDRLGVR